MPQLYVKLHNRIGVDSSLRSPILRLVHCAPGFSESSTGMLHTSSNLNRKTNMFFRWFGAKNLDWRILVDFSGLIVLY